MTNCLSCGEEVSTEDVSTGRTACCDALTTTAIVNMGLEPYVGALRSHIKDTREVFEHIHKFPADSKKRRKLYNKPADTWPGKIGSTYKKPKGSRKKVVGGKSPTPSLDITFEGQHKVSIVHPDLKIPEIVVGSNRTNARGKARRKLRDMGMTITTADEIIEEGNETVIIFR